MIHLNHAGTSWPKPPDVQAAASEALADPGDDWAGRFERQHRRVASHFGIKDPSRLLLTPGCTSALSLALADLVWRPGDRVLISAMEHHALHRPVLALAARGVEHTVLPRTAGGPLDLDALEDELKRGSVALVAISAAANVTGERLPVRDVVKLAHAHGALVLLDAAQQAGWSSIDVAALDLDLMAFAGHKALQGIWGIGGLYVAPRVAMNTPAASCDLPAPGEARACVDMPGYCDGGSVDRAALAALSAGMDWLAAPPRAGRLDRAIALRDALELRLGAMRGFRLLGAGPRLPTTAFVHEARTVPDVAAALLEEGIRVAGGLQCSPLAHEALGSAPSGTVRISLGPDTTGADIDRIADVLEDLG